MNKLVYLALVAGLAACSRGDPAPAAAPTPAAVSQKQADDGLHQFLAQPKTHVRTLAEIKAEQKAGAASQPKASEADHAKK